jgi:hypothetical protein
MGVGEFNVRAGGVFRILGRKHTRPFISNEKKTRAAMGVISFAKRPPLRPFPSPP